MATSTNVQREVSILPLRYLLHEIVLVRNSFDVQVDRVMIMKNSLDVQAKRIDSIERELKKVIEAYLNGVARPPELGGYNTQEFAMDPVAHNLIAQPRHDDSLEVTIDDGETFSVPRRLAQVFSLIVSGGKDPTGKDPLVGWRSRTEIVAFLEKNTGKRFSKRYINQMIYLLKCALREAGYNPKLIQTHRQKGVRLALKPGALGPLHRWGSADSSPS